MQTFIRKGFTLVEMLIVIVVIGVLAAMMMLSSTESVTTAKAAAIISNLQILKRATIMWYADNKEKVQPSGMVMIGSETHPVQEWTDNALHLGKYISNLGGKSINLNDVRQSVSGTTRKNTNLGVGCYGVCDGGTERNESDDEIAYHRRTWYVGYRFNENEYSVKKKIKGMQKTTGVIFGTADAHVDTREDNNVAVWLKVL